MNVNKVTKPHTHFNKLLHFETQNAPSTDDYIATNINHHKWMNFFWNQLQHKCVLLSGLGTTLRLDV